jgi:chemotaxis protein CheZ
MSNPDVPDSVHYKVGVLTRQLHDSLNELGYADRLRGSMESCRTRKAAFPTLRG